jgi:hypothetical protein
LTRRRDFDGRRRDRGLAFRSDARCFPPPWHIERYAAGRCFIVSRKK